MWLTGKLVPDHKTIAVFWRDNAVGIRKVCAQFVELCRRIGTLKGACVVSGHIAHLEADVERYITEIARIERQEVGEARTEKVEHLSRRYGASSSGKASIFSSQP
jgi:hypothetical protein